MEQREVLTVHALSVLSCTLCYLFLNHCLSENKVLIVIGGDDEYKEEDDEEQVVISRWARRKVESQFDAEYLDGRKSFIFSWNKTHRKIHEEALFHYFDPRKNGKKFQYQPKLRQKQDYGEV